MHFRNFDPTRPDPRVDPTRVHLCSLQHRVRATNSHIQNSKNHFTRPSWLNELIDDSCGISSYCTNEDQQQIVLYHQQALSPGTAFALYLKIVMDPKQTHTAGYLICMWFNIINTNKPIPVRQITKEPFICSSLSPSFRQMCSSQCIFFNHARARFKFYSFMNLAYIQSQTFILLSLLQIRIMNNIMLNCLSFKFVINLLTLLTSTCSGASG